MHGRVMRIVSHTKRPARRRALHDSTFDPLGEPSRVAAWPPLALAALAAAVSIGAWARLDQVGAQVLIDDEWHVVHQVMLSTPGEMLLDFGYADYGIPLGLLAWTESRAFGLSEMLLRLPMLACGLVTLVVFTAYVARRFAPATVAIFAWLLATSPLLVIYSRMARPYAVTLLLGWVAHAAFQRYWRAGDAATAPREDAVRTTRAPGAMALYVAAAAFATWLHPITGPFVLAPLAWAAFDTWRADVRQRRVLAARLARVVVPAGLAIALLVLPPLVANPVSMTLKSGVDTPGADTLVGAAHAWYGTASPLIVAGCLLLAALGARDVWRTLPEARTAALGVALTLASILVSRPAWSSNAASIARYLLPLLPLLLLMTAAGAVALARYVGTATPWRRAAAGGVALLPCVALALQSPLPAMVRAPGAQTLHLVHHFDFRPAKNAYLPYIEKIPLSPFWATLAAAPRGSVRVAVAPFHYESYNWDAPRWEEIAGQWIVPGYLTGLCVAQRYGEVPRAPQFRFANAVHLADEQALARQGIDLVVWQKPFEHVVRGERETVGAGTAHCDGVLRERFGPPAYEDDLLVVYRVRGARADVNAAR